jgi:DNA-binding transcriptional MerR regulator/methylmalonyl-CoA mutase cobalamin-binding subunit
MPTVSFAAGGSPGPGPFAMLPAMSPSKAGPPARPSLTIGALSRATGIPVETLRTWERRYGAPRATRRASGHRAYPLEDVGRLRRVARALELGHRASTVVRLDDADLEALLDASHDVAIPAEPARGRERATLRRPSRAAAGRASTSRDLLAAAAAFDGEGLRAALDVAQLRRTRVELLDEVIAPFLAALGAAWARGAIDVRHEHHAAAAVGDFLRALRRRLEPARPLRQAAVALLPGDRHELGALMAAVVIADAGWGVLYLGLETPPAQLVALAGETAMDAVAVSVSASRAGAGTTAALRDLRAALPAGAALLVGGAGAPARLAGARMFRDLASLDRWLRAGR